MRHVKKLMILGMAHIGLLGSISANAEFPNQWSGSLPRPIIFIHGIGTNGYGEWGFTRPSCRVTFKGENFHWFIQCSDSSYHERLENGTYAQLSAQEYWINRGKTRPDFDELPKGEVGADECFYNKRSAPLNKISTGGAGLQRYPDGRPGFDIPPVDLPEIPDGPCSPGRPDQKSKPISIPSDLKEALKDKGLQFFFGVPSERYVWDEGISAGYKRESTPGYFAQRYGLATQYDRNNPTRGGINHNGIEFYNISKEDVSIEYPLSSSEDSFIHPAKQAERLRKKIESVLDEYYSDWRINPARTIDLVAHSQGGLVVRSMLHDAIKQGVNTGLSDPLNHINHIVTTNTPHLGTAYAHADRGVTSLMQLRDYIFSKIENIDSVELVGGIFGTMDFLPKSALEPFFVLDKNAGHLRYACNLYHPAWEPSASDVADPLKMESDERVALCVENQNIPANHAYGRGYYDVEFLKPYIAYCKSKLKPMVDAWYLGNDTDCSTYISELQKTGYPKSPDGRMIPMTAMYGRVNPERVVHFLELAKAEALDQCDFIATAATLNDCKKKVRGLVNGFIKIARNGLATEWLAHSDSVVDVSSQVGLGLFEEGKHPFRKVEIRPLNPNVGVYHNNISDLESITGEKFRGAAWHAEEIFNALQSKPRAKIDMTAPYLLLLQN